MWSCIYPFVVCMNCYRYATLFCLLICSAHLHLYVKTMFCTFLWALSCHQCLCLFCSYTYLFFDHFRLFRFAIINDLIPWKLNVSKQTPPLLPLFLTMLACVMSFSVFYHHLSPSWSSFCILSKGDLFFYTLP